MAEISQQDIDNFFYYIDRQKDILTKGEQCPTRSIAYVKVEEARMWAKKFFDGEET